MIKNILQIILYIGIAICFLRCSNSFTSAGDTSETGNTVIMGTVVFPSGSPASNTEVTLISYNHNPLKDGPIPDSLIDSTDMNGKYDFNISDTGFYNIQAMNFSQGTQLLVTNIKVKNDTTIVPTATLKKTGSIQFIFPDTLDIINGKVYIKGTDIYFNLSKASLISSNYYAIILDSIPATYLPPIMYTSPKQEFIVSDTTQVISNDTTLVNITDTIMKPVWRFSCIAGVTDSTVQYYGGLDSVKIQIINQFIGINKKFNDPGVFDGILHFAIDSIYQFNTDSEAELNKPLYGFEYRVVYDGFPVIIKHSYSPKTRSLVAFFSVHQNEGPFGNYATDGLTHFFGMARGCPPLDWLKVNVGNNPINNEAYNSIKSIMNYPYGETLWDQYSVKIINFYRNIRVPYDESNLLNMAFPLSMGVKAIASNTGTPLPDVEVKLYGVRYHSFSVRDTILFTGKTDSNGKYVFSQNPFVIDTTDIDFYYRYGNFLISATHQSSTKYAWMPINEVGLVWFNNPNISFWTDFTFTNKTF